MEITSKMILEKKPCEEWIPRLQTEFAGESKTLLEILQMGDIPPANRIWVATQFLDDKKNRLFAVWCARESLKLIENPDPRLVKACEVAERYAHGEATEKELIAAWAAARAASAASAAASAAWDAAEAAGDAARAAGDAAMAARAAARDAQVKKLIEMISTKIGE